MYEKVFKYISDNNLIEEGDRIVAGVSGGADSVCLLNILYRLSKEMRIKLAVVHVNHGIRGKEADLDEAYVNSLCKKWNIDFYPYSYDVKKIASDENLTEEEAGRKVRYQAFYDICAKEGCNKIAVAHNKNDNAETFLFNLFRGSGIKGLTGMRPQRTVTDGRNNFIIIRPLLCVERKEIEIYLLNEGLAYRTDSTNLTDEYSRNKIRNRILAYAVNEINHQTIKNVNEASLKLQEAWDYIEYNTSLCYKKIVEYDNSKYLIPVDKLMSQEAIIQKGIIRHIIESMTGQLKNIESKHIEAILSLCGRQVGKYTQLPYGIIAEREYDSIIIYYKRMEMGENSPIEPVAVNIPGETPLALCGIKIITQLLQYKKGMQIPKNSCIKWFDYDKIKNAVVIRNRREGDYLCINSSGGVKKLKDYFIDSKIPRKLRDSQLLIADGSHVMWIPGVGSRISEHYKVDENTKKILLMKLIKMEGDYYDGQNKDIDTGGKDRGQSKGAGTAD